MPVQKYTDRLKSLLCVCVFLLLFFLSAAVMAQENACSPSAAAGLKQSVSEAVAAYWQKFAICRNTADESEKLQCLRDAKLELSQAVMAAIEERTARFQICDLLGEAPYDPEIDPVEFVNFDAVLQGGPFVTNPYFPLTPGNIWEYIVFDEDNEESETNRVEVLSQTKEILGVQCIVVHDQVFEIVGDEEILIEDTLDFFAQDQEGTVWYFGENTAEFENGEIVSLEGSWQAGRDGAKPGIVMLPNPQPGDAYRQEFLPGEAEDLAQVISRDDVVVNVTYGVFSDDVLETTEWTPLEPDVMEFKYYAPNTGLLLEVDPMTGEEVVLVDLTLG